MSESNKRHNYGQITNFSDIVTSKNLETVSVYIGNNHKEDVYYASISASELTGSVGIPIEKIGYVCEPRGIDFPIMVITGGLKEGSEVFYLGKTGIFEAMTETFQDINEDPNTHERPDPETCILEITAIKVPVRKAGDPEDRSIKFKLDYTFETE